MISPRKTYLDLIYNHQNITSELAEHLTGWTYTDNLSGQIDDLQITLEDIEKKWLSDWFPVKGSILQATIVKENWSSSSIKINIGKFEVDTITASSSEVTIKALAVPESNSIRGEFKTKAWENTTLKVVAQDIAKRNNLKLYYDADDTYKKDRYEQNSQTDLEFLYQCCIDEGLCLKLTNDSIVILDEADYEQQPTVATIKRTSNEEDEIHVLNWSAETTFAGTYKACQVKCQNPDNKKVISATFTPKNAPTVGRTLIVEEEVSSAAEAQKLAKKKLREVNKEATTVQLDIVTTKHFDAGNTVNLSGFGKFDGKYIITQAIHSQSGTQLSLRRCLEGY